MSYTSPPIFADGNLLSAAQMNTLSDDVEFLHGVVMGPNIPFCSVVSNTGGSLDATNAVWMIRHKHRYLHYYISQLASQSDSLEIRYDGTAVYSDGGDRTAPWAWSGYVDLDSTPGGLTVGNWYEITVHYTPKTGSGVVQVIYLLESPETSL